MKPEDVFALRDTEAFKDGGINLGLAQNPNGIILAPGQSIVVPIPTDWGFQVTDPDLLDVTTQVSETTSQITITATTQTGLASVVVHEPITPMGGPLRRLRKEYRFVVGLTTQTGGGGPPPHNPTLTFTTTTFSASLMENTQGTPANPLQIATGLPRATLDATSATLGLDITYTLTGTGADRFQLNGANLEYIGGTEDFETTSSYTLTLGASVAATEDSTAATATNSVAITITILDIDENQAPTRTSLPPPAITLTLSDPGGSVNIAPLFTDPDGNTLTYQLIAPSPPPAWRPNIALDSSTGAITYSNRQDAQTGRETGSGAWQVRATDPSGSTSPTATIMVAVTASPIVGTAPTAPADLTTSSTIAEIPFGDVWAGTSATATYSVTSSDTSAITATTTATGYALTIVGAGTATITYSVAQNGYTDSVATEYTISTPNRAPIRLRPNQIVTLPHGGPPQTFDISTWFSDPDGDTLTYALTTPGNPGSLSPILTIDPATSILTIMNSQQALDERLITNIVYQATATDPGGLTSQAVNIFMLIRASTIQGTAPTAPADLTTSSTIAEIPFGDVWAGTSATATYSVTSSDTSAITATTTATGYALTIVGAGTATITYSVAQNGYTDSVATEYTIGTANRAPVRTALAPPSISLALSDPGGSVNIASLFTDPDGDTLTYQLIAPSPLPAWRPNIALDSNTGAIAYSNRQNSQTGSGTWQVRATDPSGLNSPTADLLVAVTASPIVGTAPTAPADLTTSSTIAEIPFGDVWAGTSATATYSVTSSDTSAITATTTATGYALTIVGVGTATITYSVAQNGYTDSVATEYTISTANRAPVRTALAPPSVSLALSDPFGTANLAPLFTDPDGDTLTYQLIAPSPLPAWRPALTLATSTGALAFENRAAAQTGRLTGSGVWQVRATDPSGLNSPTADLPVAVTASPIVGTAPTAPADLNTESTIPEIPYSSVWSNTLPTAGYTASSSNPTALQVSLTSTGYALTILGAGDATITFGITQNGYSDSVTTSYTIGVSGGQIIQEGWSWGLASPGLGNIGGLTGATIGGTNFMFYVSNTTTNTLASGTLHARNIATRQASAANNINFSVSLRRGQFAINFLEAMQILPNGRIAGVVDEFQVFSDNREDFITSWSLAGGESLLAAHAPTNQAPVAPRQLAFLGPDRVFLYNAEGNQFRSWRVNSTGNVVSNFGDNFPMDTSAAGATSWAFATNAGNTYAFGLYNTTQTAAPGYTATIRVYQIHPGTTTPSARQTQLEHFVNVGQNLDGTYPPNPPLALAIFGNRLYVNTNGTESDASDCTAYNLPF